METSFEIEDDDDAFGRARTELLRGYADWATAADPPLDAEDAGVALDWKYQYGDGQLTTWTTDDLHEFVLSWCPRKLSMSADTAEPFLRAVGAFFTFLAGRGLLGSRSSGPETLRRWCDRHTGRFVKEMRNPANFGMAKSLFAGVGGLEDDVLSEEDVAALMRRVEGLSPEEFDAALGAGEVAELGPVRAPDPQEQRASATAAPVLATMARLHGYCAAPGRTLTSKGNLRLADARELVELLETGDRTESVRSAADLPELDWLVGVAADARVVRRHRGRLVAVAAWSRLDPTEALDRIVDVALEQGLDGPRGSWFASLGRADDEALQLLADLAAAEVVGEPLDLDVAVEAIVDDVGPPGVSVSEVVRQATARGVREQFDRLEQLGLLVQADVGRVLDERGVRWVRGGTGRLTAAGLGVAIRRLSDAGVTVTTRPDPATAGAGEMLDLAEVIGPEDWLEDVRVWIAGRGGGVVEEFGTALADADREPIAVLAVLAHVETLFAERPVAVVERLLGGRWDGIAVNWLADHGVPHHLETDPARGLAGFVELLSVVLDDAGPEAMVEMVPAGSDRAATLDVLERFWRLDHDRVPEVLEVTGRHHPDKAVAKAARNMLAKYRSRGPARSSRG